MAREVRTYTWCDVCLTGEEPQYVDAHEVTVTIDNMKPRVAAFCEVHEKDLIQPLREFLKEVGQPADKATAPSKPSSGTPTTTTVRQRSGPVKEPHKPRRCAVCGAVASNYQSFGGHIRNTHGLIMAAYREAHGDPQPFDRDDPQLDLESDLLDDGKVVVDCDQPECQWTARAVPTKVNQVRGVHKAKFHGIKGAGKTSRAT